MCPYKYYQIMKQSKDKKQWRYQMVQKALDDGIKPTARAFHTSPPVVRKWLKRFKTEGYQALDDHSHKPHFSPNETPNYLKEHIIMLKNKYKRVGAEQIKTLEELTMAPKTMRKIWKKAGIPSRRRPKKHVTKNNLREVKKRFKLFERMMEDTKDLIDIPEFWIPMKTLNLPKVQYTFREISCGILFLGFASQRSLTHSVLFATYINHFLKKFNALPENSKRQTDNGSEYIGSWNAKNPSAYTLAVESLDGQQHNTIFPGAHRMQADVETIHNIMEIEFYEIEHFTSRKDFINKAANYQLFFNLHRPNTYKENKNPWQLAQEKNPKLDKRLLMIPPVDLDVLLNWKTDFLTQGGNNHLTVPFKKNFGDALTVELKRTMIDTLKNTIK
ncbi:MAG TPA: helix-turn-helix domain-containing protein, partial [Ignavibacteria bacterium]|nr:helix-turn-helix domain-containing protein [Ignavibacteria bacterium]